MNVNGVPSSSPGLRSSDRYPGSPSPQTIQPQRGCAPCDAASTKPDGTALRFGSFVAHEPRVGLILFGQPWAEGRKPVGLMDSNITGIASFPIYSFPYANGVPTFSPGLRGTRYPGLWSRETIQPQRGCAPCDAASTKPDGTALRFGSFVAHEPRVGLISFGQPWAGGRNAVGVNFIRPTPGWRTEALWAIGFRTNANLSFSSFANHLIN